MEILVTGANGYIAQRLIPVLLEAGHSIHAVVRNAARFAEANAHDRMHIYEADLLQPESLSHLPKPIDVAFYLVHSMSANGDFSQSESAAAKHFVDYINQTACQQIIYLSGIVNETQLSTHLESRLRVEKLLGSSKVPLTTLRAGIIVGSGSASFEIIRDLVEKLPVMIAPKWLNTLCQPIAIRNVIHFLCGVMLKPAYYHQHFDIAGPDVLTYKQMLLQFAAVRKLRRSIITVPIMTPRLSSYWLYFVTATSYPLAKNLVDSMKVNVIASPNKLAEELQIELIPYTTAVTMAFQRIEQHMVISSWIDSFSASNTSPQLMMQVEVPKHGCFHDIKWRKVGNNETQVLDNIWSIGGKRGWYYGNFLWRIRGFMDKLAGGVGLRRGRTHPNEINAGDALDFWRVLIADKQEKRLLLFAEMKLPGEAWLEFKLMKKNNQLYLRQTATFRPKGVWGRLYWYSVLPFHVFIFNGMASNLISFKP
jgi:uncharacterized protein YbjT (DUF2867 family)